MSKYWNKMELFKKRKNEDFFISENPTFLSSDKNFQIETSFEKELNPKEINNFYSYNYNIDKGLHFTEIDSERYLNLGSLILTIRVDNNLIGSMISVFLPIKVITDLNIQKSTLSERLSFFKNEETVLFGCSSFLALDKKYRGKGYGMALIQESLNVFYKNGGLGAFFINSVSRGNNSIKLIFWHFIFDTEKIKSRYNYNIIENKEGYVRKVVKFDDSFNFYISYVKDKKFAFYPNIEYWNKWIEIFPTYVLIEKEKIIGIFSFNNDMKRSPLEKMKINGGNILFCWGKQPETLQSCIQTAKNLFDTLSICELGDLNGKLISSVNAKKHNTNKYINFFNTQIQVDSKDFYTPVF